MSLPIRPEKTTAGIVVDPRTLERVVPSSRRQDGTTRKEQKIRPGFTPQEDIGRFRSSRATTIDATRNIVPGSQRRSGTKKDPYARDGETENPFKSDPTPAEAAAGKSKAQLKNEKRREKKRTNTAGHDMSLKWDEDEDAPGEGDGGEEMKEAFERLDRLNLQDQNQEQDQEDEVESGELLGTGSQAPGRGAPEKSLAATIATTQSVSLSADTSDPVTSPAPIPDPPTSRSPTDPIMSSPAVADVAEGAAALLSSEKTERDWKAARPPRPDGPSEGPFGRGGRGGRGAPRGGRGGRGGGENGQASRQRSNNPPGSAPSNAGMQPPRAPEPRVRKEVRVREGTAGDAGSLAARVKGLLVANQERPPRKTATAAAVGQGNGESKA